jgi:mono/diheme cytochrome c family protein
VVDPAVVVAPEVSTYRGFVVLCVLAAAVFATAQTSEGAPTAAPSPSASAAPAVAGNAVLGKETFTQECSICHGAGAKGFIGPYIAGVNWGTSGLHTIVRVGIGGYGSMPAFNADAVTDTDITNIGAYLATLPPNTVPVAQHGRVISGDLVNGQKLYAANCASCHGASGQGGVGPELHGEKTRKDAAGTVVWIKQPIPPMPTLYPKPLTEKDVDDVAVFVESL